MFDVLYRKNINCSIDESLARFQDVMNAAKTKNIPVRGWVCLSVMPLFILRIESVIKAQIVS